MVNFSPVDETTPVKILTQQLGFPPSFFDADHVHLMLAGLEGKVFLWDVTTGAKQSLALGIRLNRVTQIYAK